MTKTLAYCDMCKAYIDLSGKKTIPAVVHTDKALRDLCETCGDKILSFIEEYSK